MNYKVFLVREAETDLSDIYNFIAGAESSSIALSLIDNLGETCQSLAKFPDRGQIPKELERLGVYQYRQIHYKSYRIIYETVGNDVYILGILDARRNLSDILERRIIRPNLEG